jgi:diketogulonate reductase-like aldo/keto reductase
MKTRSLSPKHADSPQVPIIGMGTWKSLDTDDQDLVDDIVSSALAAGTTLIDSSPMYGKSERTLGRALAERRADALVATKVWTDDDDVAERQIADSLSFYGGHIELLQIHNMVSWPERLRRIEELRDAGQVSYIGATHWRADSFHELEAAMATGRLDAIQIPYNPRERVVGALAADGRRPGTRCAHHAALGDG